MPKKVREGICALTGKHGAYVRCHIIPQSLTKPAVRGEPLYQSTKGRGELRRWSSWYDNNLVTRHGEDILSIIDDKAIKELRKNLLLWSSWTFFRPQVTSFAPMMPNHGYRKIRFSDQSDVIRFALSVAWRASASSLSEMGQAKVDEQTENRLREYVLGAEIDGASDFPVSLIQISTFGAVHNQTPFLDEKAFVDPENADREPLKILRLYMDGLIFHIHLSPIPEEHIRGNPVFVGATDHVLVTTVTYEVSFQYENLLHIMRETFL